MRNIEILTKQSALNTIMVSMGSLFTAENKELFPLKLIAQANKKRPSRPG